MHYAYQALSKVLPFIFYKMFILLYKFKIIFMNIKLYSIYIYIFII